MGTIHATGDLDSRIDIDKNEVQVRLVLKCFFTKVSVSSVLHYLVLTSYLSFYMQQKELTLVSGMHRSKSKHELKLLEKIPENAEATVVLVGELSPTKTLKATHTYLKMPT